MKRYQRILSICGGVSLLVILLLSSVTALLTDKEQKETLFEYKGSTVDITLNVNIDDEFKNEDGNIVVDPGENFAIEPWIENTGTGDVYVFMELDIPVVPVYDDGTQEAVNGSLFTYAETNGWHLMETTEEEEYNKYIYCYGTSDSLTKIINSDSMDEGSTETAPLMSQATFSTIQSSVDDELTLVVKAYAVTTEAYEEDGIGSPAAVWEATVEVAGE